MNRILNKKGGMALSQIIILLIGIFATAYAIGSEIGSVSADSCSLSFSYGSYTYTAASTTKITRNDPDNWYYTTSDSGATWYWHNSSSGNSGLVSATTEGNATKYNTWLSNAQSVVECYDTTYSASTGNKCIYHNEQVGTYSSSTGIPTGLEEGTYAITYYTKTSGDGKQYIYLDSSGGYNYWSGSAWLPMVQVSVKDTVSGQTCEEVFGVESDEDNDEDDSDEESGFFDEMWGYYQNALAADTYNKGKEYLSNLLNPTSEGGGTPTTDVTNWLGGTGTTFPIILKFATHAGIAYSLYELSSWVISYTDLNDIEGYAEWVSWMAAIGYGVGVTLAEIIAAQQAVNAVATATATAGFPLQLSFGTALAASGPFAFLGWGLLAALVAAGLTAMFYPVQDQEVVIFSCYTWTPETGGSSCDECGADGLPCSKYECLSLGQACEFLNEGTEDEICEWVNPNDISPPLIEAWDDALPSNDYSYEPLDTTTDDTGVIIEYSDTDDGCIPYWSVISLGVELDEAATCKYSLERTDSYEDMENYFSSRLILYNHSLYTSFASSEALEDSDINLDNSGEWEIYVRCEDANGNSNVGEFIFQFCVSDEPDTTPPEIVLTSPLNGMPISQGETEVGVVVYANELATCKWDYSDTSYDSMTHTMTCASSVTEVNALMLYACTGTLDGMSDATENTYYFRCNDSAGNVMTDSYEYTLVGTKDLVISSVGPDGTIEGASTAVEVTLEAETSAGYNEGAAVCYYSEGCYTEGGGNSSWVKFAYETGTEDYSQYQHSQTLWLSAGDYDCSIKCIDLGGNTDIATTSYTVETDLDPPTVIGAYYDGGELVFITDEEAECVYSTSTCNYLFDDGVSISGSSDYLTHSVTWDTENTLYIKCQDEQGVQPSSASCSIVLRPSDFF